MPKIFEAAAQQTRKKLEGMAKVIFEDTVKKRIWCPFADDEDFECVNIGVLETCTDGINPCLKLEDYAQID